MSILALALSLIQPADACAMPRMIEAPIVAKQDTNQAKEAEKQATAPAASLEAALAEIDGAAAIPEVAPPAQAPAASANKKAAAVTPST